MRPRTANLFAALLLITLNWLPCISLAHDFWIDPDRFDLRAGDAVALTLRQGVSMKGNSLPYLTPLIADFSTTDGTGRKVIQSGSIQKSWATSVRLRNSARTMDRLMMISAMMIDPRSRTKHVMPCDRAPLTSSRLCCSLL